MKLHECWKRQEHFTRCAFILFTHSYVCFGLVLLLRIGPYAFSDPNDFFFLDRDLVLRDYVVELFCRSMVGQ